MHIDSPAQKISYSWEGTIKPLGHADIFPKGTPSIDNALHPKSDGPIVAQLTAKELDIPQEISQVLARTSLSILAVTDVVHDPHDIDARLTITDGNHAIPTDMHYADPALLPYIAELVCNLRDDELLRLAQEIDVARQIYQVAIPDLCTDRESTLWSLIPDVTRERIIELLQYTKRVNLNNAARNQSTEDHDKDDPAKPKNGPDYFLAMTDTGIEFTVTSLSILQYIKNRIVAIFRIPNGVQWPEGEQFRSRMVALFGHTYAHALKKVWIKSVNTPVELDEHIPPEPSDPRVAYIDSFNNRRIRVPDLQAFWKEVTDNAEGDTVYIEIGGTVVACFVGHSLTSGPGGKHTIYLNPADHQNAGPGYIEFTRRLDDGADIQGTWEPEGPQNPSTVLKVVDRKMGILAKILPYQEGESRFKEQEDTRAQTQTLVA